MIGQIVDALTAHDHAEHAALYPLAAAVLGDVDLVARYEVAHMLVKRQIDEVRTQEGPGLASAVEELRLLVSRACPG